MRQPNMAYRGVPARGYPIGPDNRRRPGRTGFSPFSRSTRFPFTSTASPPAPLAIRKTPSGRRRKSRRQSHKFFKHLLRLAPQLAATPWGGSPPRPLCQKICYQTAQKTALCAPWEHPGGFGIRKSASNSGHSPLRGLGGGLGDASPARRGSRSRTASPPAPLAIRKAPSARVESIEPRPPQPCEVGRPKGRRRKNRRQSHKLFKHLPSGWHPNSPPRPGEAPHPAPSARKSATRTAQKTALCAPCEHPGGFGIRKSASNSGHSPLRSSGG